MGEFVKVRGLPTHGGIHQGKGSTRSWGNSSKYGVYTLGGGGGGIRQGKVSTHSWGKFKFVKVRSLPTHGGIR